MTSFCVNSTKSELVVATFNGIIKRFDIEAKIDVDWINKSEQRISHITYLEEKNDTIVCISANGKYSIEILNGENKKRESLSIETPEKITIKNEKKLGRRIIYGSLAIIVVTIAAMKVIYYIMY